MDWFQGLLQFEQTLSADLNHETVSRIQKTHQTLDRHARFGRYLMRRDRFCVQRGVVVELQAGAMDVLKQFIP